MTNIKLNTTALITAHKQYVRLDVVIINTRKLQLKTQCIDYSNFSSWLSRHSAINYVLLSPIVSGGVQPNPAPGQTPVCHKPPCLLLFVGRLGSGPHLGQIGSGVRVSVSFLQNTRRVLSYDFLRQQKTGVMTKGVVSGERFDLLSGV